MGESDYRGRFLWHELLTSDPDGAKRFYPRITGWGTQEWEGEMPYTLWTSGGATLGGLMRMPDEAKDVPPYWMPYIGTPDVDATHRRAVEIGGVSHVAPTDIPSVGRFAVIADPQGAVFTAFTPANQPSEEERPDGAPPVGRFSWNELATTDVDAAFGFYADVFGWEKISDFDMGPMGVYQIYGHGGAAYGGIYTKPAEVPGPAFWLCYVRVPDVHEAARATTEGGGKVLAEPMEVPGGDWIVQLADPAGAAFAVHQKQA